MTSTGDLLKLYQQGCLSDMHFLHVLTGLFPHAYLFSALDFIPILLFFSIEAPYLLPAV